MFNSYNAHSRVTVGKFMNDEISHSFQQKRQAIAQHLILLALLPFHLSFIFHTAAGNETLGPRGATLRELAVLGPAGLHVGGGHTSA